MNRESDPTENLLHKHPIQWPSHNPVCLINNLNAQIMAIGQFLLALNKTSLHNTIHYSLESSDCKRLKQNQATITILSFYQFKSAGP